MGGQLSRAMAYLDAMPAGVASYPECMVKGAVVRTFLGGLPMRAAVELLPRPLGELVLHPPTASSWVPEVQATALYLAAIDLHLNTDEAFERHAYAMNMKLLDSTMYRILFRFVGVRRLVQQIGTRWEPFHRGTTLSAEHFDADAGVARLLLRSPPGLVPVVLARGYATAVRVALELAGQKSIECSARPRDERCVELSCRWA